MHKPRPGSSNQQWLNRNSQQGQAANIRHMEQLIISDDSCWKKSLKPTYETHEPAAEDDRYEHPAEHLDLSKKNLILGEINTMKGLKMIINQRLKTLDDKLKRMSLRKTKKEPSLLMDQSQDHLQEKLQPLQPTYSVHSKSSRQEMLRSKVEALFSSSIGTLEDLKSHKKTGLHPQRQTPPSSSQNCSPGQQQPQRSATSSGEQAVRSTGPLRSRPQTDLKVVPLNITSSLKESIRDRRASVHRLDSDLHKDTLVAVEFLPARRDPISTKLQQMRNPFKQNEILLKKDLQLRNLTRGVNQDKPQPGTGSSPPNKWQTPQFTRLAADSQAIDKRPTIDRIGGASEQAAPTPQQTRTCILIENLDTDESEQQLASSPSEEKIMQFIKSYY